MTNVKVILAGLDAYGTMWDGIDMMAGSSDRDCQSCLSNVPLILFSHTGEVRAALDAAKKLPEELRNSSQSPPVMI